MNKQTILGIDPAPSKESVVFDGQEFHLYKAKNLKIYIESLIDNSDFLLIGWDAPLTAAIYDDKINLYFRKIEKFFNSKLLDIPNGISTLGYAACPHWTISQYIFGLPILNPYLQNSSITQINSENELNQKGNYIVETHPALSIWILLKDKLKDKAEFKNNVWRYKGNKGKKENKERLSIFIEKIFDLEIVKNTIGDKNAENIKNEIKKSDSQMDDKLDAFICWLNVKLLYEDKFNIKRNKNPNMKIYGDKNSGSFLLPYDKEIIEKLNEFLKQ